MFRRTTKLFKEHSNDDLSETAKKIIDRFTPNTNLFNSNLPYTLRGEHLPRAKINPYKKTPLRVIYDHEDFASFVLPSRRSTMYHSKNLKLLK